MGNITKIEKPVRSTINTNNCNSLNIQPSLQISNEYTEVATRNHSNPGSSKLVDWRCIHDNGTTPFLRSYDISLLTDGNKIYILDGPTEDSTETTSELYTYDGNSNLNVFFVDFLSWMVVFTVVTKQFELFEME